MVRGWTGTSEQNNCSCMLRILGRWSLRQDYSCGCKWKQCGRPGQPEGKKGKKVRSGRYWSVRNRRRWILAVRVGDAPVILDLSLPTASDEAQCVFQVEHPCKFQPLLGAFASRWGKRATASSTPSRLWQKVRLERRDSNLEATKVFLGAVPCQLKKAPAFFESALFILRRHPN